MRIRSFDKEKAILYLVATPIGNLGDITLRALEILKSVDKIYAEDTRNSQVLLNHYGIKTRLESYHEFNQDLKEPQILSELERGQRLAVISDAGLPVISDPGYRLARVAIEHNIAVSTIPGASAGISALIASGLVPAPFTFYGFLDSKATKRLSELEEIKYLKSTLIFYEAPHRILETLKAMLEVLGDREICLARELTKSYEEFIRGKISDVLKELPVKGEIVLIVSGYQEKEIIENPLAMIDNLIQLGTKPNEAIKAVAREMNISRSELYKNYIEYKNK